MKEKQLREKARTIADGWIAGRNFAPTTLAAHACDYLRPDQRDEITVRVSDVREALALAVLVQVQLQNRRGMEAPFDRAGFLTAMLTEAG